MAELLYAGQAPFLLNGVAQINARIPASIPIGNAAVSVTVGGSMTAQLVTVAVR